MLQKDLENSGHIGLSSSSFSEENANNDNLDEFGLSSALSDIANNITNELLNDNQHNTPDMQDESVDINNSSNNSNNRNSCENTLYDDEIAHLVGNIFDDITESASSASISQNNDQNSCTANKDVINSDSDELSVMNLKRQLQSFDLSSVNDELTIDDNDDKKENLIEDEEINIDNVVSNAIAEIVNQTMDTNDSLQSRSENTNNSLIFSQTSNADEISFPVEIDNIVSSVVEQVANISQENDDVHYMNYEDPDKSHMLENIVKDSVAEIVNSATYNDKKSVNSDNLPLKKDNFSDLYVIAQKHQNDLRMEKELINLDMAEAAIAQIVHNVVQSLPSQTEEIKSNTDDIIANKAEVNTISKVPQIKKQKPSSVQKRDKSFKLKNKSDISKTKKLQDNIVDNMDFQLAMSEMIQNVADEIVSSNVSNSHSEQSNELQFAIEEMVKNVVDETYEDILATQSENNHSAQSSFLQTRLSLIDSILNNSELTSSIVANTLIQRRQQLISGKPINKDFDPHDVLSQRKPFIDSSEYADTPNLRDLLNKHASEAFSKGFPLTLKKSVGESSNNKNALISDSKITSKYSKKNDAIPITKLQAPLINVSIAQVINLIIQSIILNQKLLKSFLIETSQKTRLEDKTKNKKWRRKNNCKNKDSELKFRVSKRANLVFGEEDSEEKTKWFDEEFNKRKMKRLHKLTKNNDQFSNFDPDYNNKKKIIADTIFDVLIKSLKNICPHDLQITSEATNELHKIIDFELQNVYIEIASDQIYSTVNESLDFYFKSEESTVNKSVDLPKIYDTSSTPSALELQKMVKERVASGKSIFSNTESIITKKAITNENDASNINKAFSSISFLHSKRKSSFENDSHSSKRSDTSLRKSIPDTKSIKSFRLPVYRKSLAGLERGVFSTQSKEDISNKGDLSKSEKSVVLDKSNDSLLKVQKSISKITRINTSIEVQNDRTKITDKHVPIVKKPSIVSSIDIQRKKSRPSLASVVLGRSMPFSSPATSSPILNRRSIGLNSFRRPLYRSSTTSS